MPRKKASLNMPTVSRVCGAQLTSTSTCPLISPSQAGSRSSATHSGLGRGLGSTARTLMPKP